MIHLLVIALFASVLSRETFREALFYDRLGAGGAVAVTLGAVVTIWLACWMIVSTLARRLERRGDARSIGRADAVVLFARIATVVVMVLSVVYIGWLDAVRDGIASLRGIAPNARGRSGGDLIAIDELIAVLPGLLGLSVGWWVMYPIDRFVREATLIRDLDSGHAVHPILPRRKWTWQAVRHHLAIVVLPITAIVVWSEAVVFAAEASMGLEIAHRLGNGSQTGLGVELGVSAVKLVGAISVLALMPVVMCKVWDTVPLRPPITGQGENHDGDQADDKPVDMHARLMAHCTSARVRVRGIRVWRTGGAMVNGAVIGLIAPLRYVLLTDALLERLSPRELEAVMAHEVAHIKLRHMPWLVCAVLGTVLPAAAGMELALSLTDIPVMPRLELALVGGVFAMGLIVFGWVSRRFEWQADAYAARSMSERVLASRDEPSAESDGEPNDKATPERFTETARTHSVTLAGADSMIAALQRVADLNHVPVRRRSWRHGSIFQRQQRLYDLVGVKNDAIPIDRVVRCVKIGSAVAFVVGLASTAWSIYVASGA